MVEKGWLKLHRKLIQKPIWKQSTPEQKAILITILCMVNHEEKEWEWQGKKYICQPGQVITSLDKIAKEAGKGISIQNVRTALKRFEKFEFLTNESTKESRLITIQNWELYQSSDNELTKELTNGSQRANKGVTTNKNDKNDKNDKNIKDICADEPHTPTKKFTPPTLEEVKAYCQERKNNVDPEKWYDFYESKGWMIGKNKMKDWKAAVRTWERERSTQPQQYKTAAELREERYKRAQEEAMRILREQGVITDDGEGSEGDS